MLAIVPVFFARDEKTGVMKSKAGCAEKTGATGLAHLFFSIPAVVHISANHYISMELLDSIRAGWDGMGWHMHGYRCLTLLLTS